MLDHCEMCLPRCAFACAVLLVLVVFTAQAADIARLESSPPLRIAHLERLLGVPLMDRSAGFLGLAYSRRYRPYVQWLRVRSC
jgi:hypothetical protein